MVRDPRLRFAQLRRARDRRAGDAGPAAENDGASHDVAPTANAPAGSAPADDAPPSGPVADYVKTIKLLAAGATAPPAPDKVIVLADSDDYWKALAIVYGQPTPIRSAPCRVRS